MSSALLPDGTLPGAKDAITFALHWYLHLALPVTVNDSSTTGLGSVLDFMMHWIFPKSTLASLVDELWRWMFPPLVINGSSDGFQRVIEIMVQWAWATLKLGRVVNGIYLWLMILGVLYHIFSSYESRPQWLKNLPRRPILRRLGAASLPIYSFLWILARICYGGVSVIETGSDSLIMSESDMLLLFLFLLMVSRFAIFHPIDLLWGRAATLLP